MSSEFLLIWEHRGQNLAPGISFSGTAIAVTTVIFAPCCCKACQLGELQAFLYTFQMTKSQVLVAFSALLGPINQSTWTSTILGYGRTPFAYPCCTFWGSDSYLHIKIMEDGNEATEKPTSDILSACFNRKWRSLWLWRSQRTMVMDSL